MFPALDWLQRAKQLYWSWPTKIKQNLWYSWKPDKASLKSTKEPEEKQQENQRA